MDTLQQGITLSPVQQMKTTKVEILKKQSFKLVNLQIGSGNPAFKGSMKVIVALQWDTRSLKARGETTTENLGPLIKTPIAYSITNCLRVKDRLYLMDMAKN